MRWKAEKNNAKTQTCAEKPKNSPKLVAGQSRDSRARASRGASIWAVFRGNFSQIRVLLKFFCLLAPVMAPNSCSLFQICHFVVGFLSLPSNHSKRVTVRILWLISKLSRFKNLETPTQSSPLTLKGWGVHWKQGRCVLSCECLVLTQWKWHTESGRATEKEAAASVTFSHSCPCHTREPSNTESRF